MEAREYVDGMCVKHGRWMLESGTLGTKGNTQVPQYTVSQLLFSSAPQDSPHLQLSHSLYMSFI